MNKKNKDQIKENINKNFINYKPDYCFYKKDDCKKKENEICFHVLGDANEEIFKNKKNILIYGPNGTGKTYLSNELQKQSKKNEIIFFAFDSTYISKTFYYTDHEGEKKIKVSQKKGLKKELNLQNETILKLRKKLEDAKETIIKRNLKTQIDKIINDELTEYIELIVDYSENNINKVEIEEEIKKIINERKSIRNEEIENDLNNKEWFLTSNNNIHKNDIKNENHKELKEKIKDLFYLKFDCDDARKEITNYWDEMSTSKNDFQQNKELEFLKKLWLENDQLKKWIDENKFNEKLNTTIKDFINWQKKGIDFYQEEKFDKEVCVFCLRKDYKENKNIKDLTEQKIIKTKTKVTKKFETNADDLIKFIKKNILDFFNEKKMNDFFIRELNGFEEIICNIESNKQKWLNDKDNNLEPLKIDNLNLIDKIENKIKEFYNKKNSFESLFIYLNETIFFQNKIKIIVDKKLNFDYLEKEIKEINKNIRIESEKIIKKVNDELKIIKEIFWKKKFNIKLKHATNSGETSIKIVDENSSNKEEIFKFASTGERKALALILFFVQIKRQIKNDNKSKYILIFDDISDELDFSAYFKIDKLLKYFLETKGEIFKNKIKYKIFLTHRIDFIFTFFMQHPKQRDSIIFFRLFNNVDHKFLLSLNFEKLMKTDALLFREYLKKFLNFNNEKTIFNQIIFWAISKRCIERILTEKINLLYGKKINFIKNDGLNKQFGKYLDFLEVNDSEKGKYKNIKKLLDKWKNKEYLFIEKEGIKINSDTFIKTIESIVILLKNIKVINDKNKIEREKDWDASIQLFLDDLKNGKIKDRFKDGKEIIEKINSYIGEFESINEVYEKTKSIEKKYKKIQKILNELQNKELTKITSDSFIEAIKSIVSLLKDIKVENEKNKIEGEYNWQNNIQLFEDSLKGGKIKDGKEIIEKINSYIKDFKKINKDCEKSKCVKDKFQKIKKLLTRWEKRKKLFINKHWIKINLNPFIEDIKSIILLLKNINIINKKNKIEEEYNWQANIQLFEDSLKSGKIKDEFKDEKEIIEKINSYIEDFKTVSNNSEESENIEEKYTDYVLLNYAYFFIKMIQKMKTCSGCGKYGNSQNDSKYWICENYLEDGKEKCENYSKKIKKSNNDKIGRFLRHANNNFFPDILIYDKEFFDAALYELKKDKDESVESEVEDKTEENKELLLEVEKNN